MSTPPPNTINHDTAARLIKLTPDELAKLVSQGHIPRVGKDAYLLPALVQAYIDHLRAEHQRQRERPTQEEIAEHLDISTRRVRELATEWGIESKTLALSAWRLTYLRQLREKAAGRATDGNLDLATERAGLAKEQKDRVAMQNAVTRRELAPVILIEQVLAKAGSKVAGILDAIPGMVRRRIPALSADEIRLIADEVSRARNIAAAVTLADIVDEIDEPSTPADIPEIDT